MTAVSASLPSLDRIEAQEIARWIGFRHELVTSQETHQRYLENTPNRCFFCKSNVYDRRVVNIEIGFNTTRFAHSILQQPGKKNKSHGKL